MRRNNPDINLLYRALANQTRRNILHDLEINDLSLSTIAYIYEMSIQGATKHLLILRRAKLVSFYHLNNMVMYRLSKKSTVKLMADIAIWYNGGKSA